MWSTFYFKSVSEECVTEEDSYTYQVYVYDRGWRVAKREELCYGKACTAMSGGESIIWNGRTYVCSDTAWRQENVYNLDKSSFFASDVVYGSLTDERDGQVYKTVKIGTQVWMAENLNYADSLKDVVLQDGASFCYDYDDDNCAVGGRFYRWAAAMGLLSKYNNYKADETLLKSSNHRGLCPEGWHIPDTTEWNTLIATVGKGNASLMLILLALRLIRLASVQLRRVSMLRAVRIARSCSARPIRLIPMSSAILAFPIVRTSSITEVATRNIRALCAVSRTIRQPLWTILWKMNLTKREMINGGYDEK